MSAADQGNGMTLQFWGVRGSLPTPGPATVRYGGNTICVELRCGPHLLILDAGSGLREFGSVLAASGVPIDADILLSHTHLDHICGLPFFAAMFDPQARIRFWGGHLARPDGIAEALCAVGRRLSCPTWMRNFARKWNSMISMPETICNCILRFGKDNLLRHPGNAIGYRINWGGSSVCYITDTEHPADGPDSNLLQFVAGADVMIYDASYTDAEYQSRVGMGHSTWQVGANLADAAAVGRLVLFHHDPGHDDTTMDVIGSAVASRRPGSLVAMEGMLTCRCRASRRITAGVGAAGQRHLLVAVLRGGARAPAGPRALRRGLAPTQANTPR